MTTATAGEPHMSTTPAKGLNLALAFLLELILLAAIAYSAFHLHVATEVKWLVGIAAPLGLAVIWSLIAAPTAKRRLAPIPLVAFKVAVFTFGAIALYSTGQRAPALLLEAAALINLALSVIWHQ